MVKETMKRKKSDRIRTKDSLILRHELYRCAIHAAKWRNITSEIRQKLRLRTNLELELHDGDGAVVRKRHERVDPDVDVPDDGVVMTQLHQQCAVESVPDFDAVVAVVVVVAVVDVAAADDNVL